MGDVSDLKIIGENLKLTASPLQYKNLRQSFTVRAGKKIGASDDKAVINVRKLLTLEWKTQRQVLNLTCLVNNQKM